MKGIDACISLEKLSIDFYEGLVGYNALPSALMHDINLKELWAQSCDFHCVFALTTALQTNHNLEKLTLKGDSESVHGDFIDQYELDDYYAAWLQIKH